MIGQKTLYLARHAQTVFNRAGRLQGNKAHTPLTSAGLQQAQAMASLFRAHLGPQPKLKFWCSPTGRTRQTAAAIADALEIDYFDITIDERLQEIDVGAWTGQLFTDVEANHGPVLDRTRRIFLQRPHEGEWYDDMAARLTSWARDMAAATHSVHLAVSHGLASRVLRGALHQRDWHEDVQAMIAPDVPQGHVVQIQGARETILEPGGPRSIGAGF